MTALANRASSLIDDVNSATSFLFDPSRPPRNVFDIFPTSPNL
jgi:hypothetical protein